MAGTGRRRCGAVFPSRRSKPLGPGAPAARHGGVRPMGKGQSVRDIPQGLSRTAEATSSDSRQVQKRWRGRPLTRQPESVSPPGVERSKPINTARGTPGLRQFRGDYVCALSTKHRAQSCGVVRTPAFRAPSLGAKLEMRIWECGLPGADQTMRAMTHVCLLHLPSPLWGGSRAIASGGNCDDRRPAAPLTAPAVRPTLRPCRCA